MRLPYLEDPETWTKAYGILKKLAIETNNLYQKNSDQFKKVRNNRKFAYTINKPVYTNKPPKKEITLQTIIDDIDELLHVCKLIKEALDGLFEIFSPKPTYTDFLELLSQNTDFDINQHKYRSDCIILAVLHDLLLYGLDSLPDIVQENRVLSRGAAPYIVLFIFIEDLWNSFLLDFDAGIAELKKIKAGIRNRCRAHFSRQLEPIQITRVVGVKLADMILKKAWSGQGQSPPDFYWQAGQNPGLSWAKRGLTQALRGAKKIIYKSLLVFQEGAIKSHKNYPLRLITAKSFVRKWAFRLSQMVKPNQPSGSDDRHDHKTIDPRFPLLADNVRNLMMGPFFSNKFNGHFRPMARDGDQIAFHVERLIGPIVVGGRKPNAAVYRERVVVVQNYVTGESFTLSSTFPGSVEKILFSGDCIVVWSEPTFSRFLQYYWQKKSCVTIWSRKTGVFLRVLDWDTEALHARFPAEEMSFKCFSKEMNVTASIMNVIMSNGSKNIWATWSVVPFYCSCKNGVCYPNEFSHRKSKLLEKTGKMSVRKG